MMLSSIIRSKQTFRKNIGNQFLGTVSSPNILSLRNKNWEELRDLNIAKVQWYHHFTFGFTLSDGQSCKAGTTYDFKKSHSFDPNKKITKVETIIHEIYTAQFIQINFYHNEERLVAVNDTHSGNERREVFDILDDERLIGCELD